MLFACLPGLGGGMDRFTGSPLRRADAAEVAHLFRHTSWFIHQSSAPLRTDDSVPQQALVCVCTCVLGQVFNGHVITSSCVHHPGMDHAKLQRRTSRRHRALRAFVSTLLLFLCYFLLFTAIYIVSSISKSIKYRYS